MATWAWRKQDLHLPARRLPKVARKWHRSLSWSWRRDGVSSEWSEIKTTGGQRYSQNRRRSQEKWFITSILKVLCKQITQQGRRGHWKNSLLKNRTTTHRNCKRHDNFNRDQSDTPSFLLKDTGFICVHIYKAQVFYMYFIGLHKNWIRHLRLLLAFQIVVFLWQDSSFQ